MKAWTLWAWNLKMCPSEQIPTGWSDGLSQDYNRKLGNWFANRLGAQQELRELYKDMKPTPMSLYPTMGSVAEVVALADSKIPVTHRNEMFSLLMTFQNTLLKQIKE